MKWIQDIPVKFTHEANWLLPPKGCAAQKSGKEGKQDTFPEISFMDEMGLTNIFLKMELWN